MILRTRALGGLVLLTLVAMVALVGCKPHGQPQALGGQRPPAMVTVAPATVRDVPAYLEEIGKTLSREIVGISPQVGGKIIAAHVVDGAYVEKGELLFEIDPRPFQAALASAEAALAQAKAEREWSQIEVKRQEWLQSQNSATQYEFDQKRVGLAVADAKVEAAKAAIDAAKLDVEYSKIYSPITGRAGARLVHPGNVVRANDPPLLVVQQLDPIYVEFTVNENDLNMVRKHLSSRGLEMAGVSSGLKVEVDVPTSQSDLLAAFGVAATQPASAPIAAVSSRPTSASTQPVRRQAGPRQGILTFLDNSVQTGAGTVKLRATVPNADHYFWPGQYVNARLILDTLKDAVMIPAQAQQVGQQGPFVYVVDANHTAVIRPIAPGQRHGDQIVILRGLSSGEKVIVTGQNMVMPGAVVMVTNEGPPPGGPPGAPAGTTASAEK